LREKYMKNRNVVIICRNRNITVDIKKASLQGLLTFGSHIKQTYFYKYFSYNSSVKRIKARIESNIQMPEWIGNHRFGIFDLLNYVKNKYRYVYDPEASSAFFNPAGIPSSTSIHIYDYLIKNRYSPVNIDNFAGNELNLKNLLSSNPLAVVISATFLNAKQIEDIIQFIRKTNRSVPIMIGSDFLLSRLKSNKHLPEEYEKIISKNVIAILEEFGLQKLVMILERLTENIPFTDLPNIVYSDNEMVQYTDSQNVSHDFDSNFPDWSNVSDICEDVAFIRASWGCPYKCKFCTFPKANLKFRQRSVESIREELKKIDSAGIKNIAFTDDHFAISPSRVVELCKMMIEEKFNFNWFAGIRASAINDETAELLADSGCKILCVGLESGDDRMLQLINKQTTTAGNLKCLKALDKYNITAYGSFLLGFPGETAESVGNTIDWINSSPLRLYKVFLFYLLPGSIIYDEQEKHNISYFGETYDYCLWRTPTMDALKASELLKEFILKIENAALIYNYSPMYAFFPFLSKGYTIKEAINILRVRTELIKNELSNQSIYSKKKNRIAGIKEIERLLK
jgi:p-methyltransferase